MTDPLPPRARTPFRRPLAALGTAVAGAAFVTAALATAVFTPVAATPASAAPGGSPCPARFGATASSELLALSARDAAPLGVDLTRLGVDVARLDLSGADVRIGTTHSGMAGGPVHAAAEARLIKAKLLGQAVPESVLGARAYQQAPPPHERPETSVTAAVDLGVFRLGAGALSARATWQNGNRCDPTGPRATSTSSVAEGSVGKKLVSWAALETATASEVVTEGGRPAAAATATAGMSRLVLFAGTPQAITIKVVSQPRLRVVAGAHKTVEYAAPILELAVPGRAPQRLSTAGDHIDVSVPADRSGRTAVLRIALGQLDKETTSTGVHAKATAVRIKLLVRAGHDAGYGGAEDVAEVLNLGLCKLEAAADAPVGGLPPYGGGGGAAGGGPSSPSKPHSNGTENGKLPVTGDSVGLTLGGGVLLVLGGRLLTLLARRRAR